MVSFQLRISDAASGYDLYIIIGHVGQGIVLARRVWGCRASVSPDWHFYSIPPRRFAQSLGRSYMVSFFPLNDKYRLPTFHLPLVALQYILDSEEKKDET